MSREFNIDYVFSFIPKMLSYLHITLFIVASSLVLGLIIGLLVALPRMYNIPFLKRVSQVYVSFFRGTPILIQLFLVYYGLPELLKLVDINSSRWDVLWFAVATYALNSGAFISEIIRSGVEAVDRGQIEAAQSVGMSGYQTFTRIIMPQALAVVIPVFSNLVIGNLKDTSLAFTIGAMEMTGKSQTLGSATQHFVETYIALSLIYLVISLILQKLFKMLENTLLRHEHRDAVQKEPEERKSFVVRYLRSPRLSKGGKGI
ncbi:amino acid ABC transporter permease [Paenibacillus sp. FSL M8-0228]|uniref:amino acid ABC transporter permease n=1 Tax=Paenibacillus TaxID=44249 RepID=UPI00083DF37C|nr:MULTISPECIES: amino acid ABC transporter permease [Paenibacillus]MBO3284509.1 amino acid ABC transporter permease [Paenibacillus polymyxa]MBP1308587.1 L-cystine transport system permease protein [Paenibacillus sp. 1182]ODB59545.1 cysteine ABC transporter permease [Paenibacillus polymyxa]